MRFGTLIPSIEQLTHPLLSEPKIAKETGFPQPSVHRMLQNYIMNGFRIVSNYSNCGRRPDNIPVHVRDWILDRRQL